MLPAGRGGINVVVESDHAAEAGIAHTHNTGDGLVARDGHSHSDHRGSHSHPTDDDDDLTNDVAAIPLAANHNADVHTHGGDGNVAGVSGHMHPDVDDDSDADHLGRRP